MAGSGRAVSWSVGSLAARSCCVRTSSLPFRSNQPYADSDDRPCGVIPSGAGGGRRARPRRAHAARARRRRRVPALRSRGGSRAGDRRAPAVGRRVDVACALCGLHGGRVGGAEPLERLLGARGDVLVAPGELGGAASEQAAPRVARRRAGVGEQVGADPVERAGVVTFEVVLDALHGARDVVVEDPQVQRALVAEGAVEARLAEPGGGREVAQRRRRVARVPEAVAGGGDDGRPRRTRAVGPRPEARRSRRRRPRSSRR